VTLRTKLRLLELMLRLLLVVHHWNIIFPVVCRTKLRPREVNLILTTSSRAPQLKPLRLAALPSCVVHEFFIHTRANILQAPLSASAVLQLEYSGLDDEESVPVWISADVLHVAKGDRKQLSAASANVDRTRFMSAERQCSAASAYPPRASFNFFETRIAFPHSDLFKHSWLRYSACTLAPVTLGATRKYTM
jgi:hypothetical protein